MKIRYIAIYETMKHLFFYGTNLERSPETIYGKNGVDDESGNENPYVTKCPSSHTSNS